MSDDFITALQHDLVDALERYERRSPPRRVAPALRPRAWRPVLLGAAAAASILACVVLAVRSLQPEPAPVRPRVVAVLPIGGTPVDAAFGEGSLWATDFTGAVVGIDPGSRRVFTRIGVPGAPALVAVDDGSVWVRTDDVACHATSHLLRIDASTGRLAVAQREVGGGHGLAADAGSVWVHRCSLPRGAVPRLDRSGNVTASTPLGPVNSLAAGGGSLWALMHDGTVVEIDPDSGRVTRRHRGVGPLSGPEVGAMNAMVPDGKGLWTVNPDRGAIIHVDGGRVVGEIAVDPSVRPLLAKAHDGLWTVTADGAGAHHRLLRLDPGTGRVTATLDIGTQRPVALVPAGDELCVLTADGKVLFVGT